MNLMTDAKQRKEHARGLAAATAGAPLLAEEALK